MENNTNSEIHIPNPRQPGDDLTDQQLGDVMTTATTMQELRQDPEMTTDPDTANDSVAAKEYLGIEQPADPELSAAGYQVLPEVEKSKAIANSPTLPIEVPDSPAGLFEEHSTAPVAPEAVQQPEAAVGPVHTLRGRVANFLAGKIIGRKAS